MKKIILLFIALGLQTFTFGQIKDAAIYDLHYITPTYAGSITTFQVQIKNSGTDTLNMVPFIIKYNNITTLDTLNALLSPGLSANHAFSLNVISCENELTVISNLPNDANSSNDTLRETIIGGIIIPVISTFSDDFETNNNCFNSNTGWERGIPSSPVIDTAHSYLNCWKTNLSGFYAPNSHYYLYSPYFDFNNSPNMVTLKFWHYYVTEPNADGARVQYSLNGGSTWLTLGLVNDPHGTHWYNSTLGGIPVWTGNSGGWIQSTFDLSALPVLYSTMPVQFRFELFTNALNSQYDGWAIDDFMLEVSCKAEFLLLPDTAVLHHYYALNYSSGVPPISYLWSWGDGNTSTGPYPSHTYATAGWYNICLTITDLNGCTSTYCDSSYLQKSTNTIISIDVIPPENIGMDETNKLPVVSLFPNPATSTLTIDGFSNTATAEIYNISGKLLLSAPLYNNQVDINPLAPGLYFIKLSTPEGSVVRKFIKN